MKYGQIKIFLNKLLEMRSSDLLSSKIEGIVLEIVKTKYAEGENTISHSELMKHTQTASPHSLELALRNLSNMNILISKDVNSLTITDKPNQEFERRKNEGSLL